MNRYEYMWIKMADIPQDITDQYGLTAKAVNGKVLVEMWKGMYGLKQDGRNTSDRLKQHLKASGYVPCRYIPGLFTYISRNISFALCVDAFGVKYTYKADAQHPLTCLEKLYKCTTDWEGKLYLGITLNWNYSEKWMEKSMPGYIDKEWTRFYGANLASKFVEAPPAWKIPPPKRQTFSPRKASNFLENSVRKVAQICLIFARARSSRAFSIQSNVISIESMCFIF